MSGHATQSPEEHRQAASGRREVLRRVIFEADTAAGKVFDVTLLVVIVLSVILVMMESIATVEQDHGDWLRFSEWIITGLFTIEYSTNLAQSVLGIACIIDEVVPLLCCFFGDFIANDT